MGWRDDNVDDIDIRVPKSRSEPPPAGPFRQSGLGITSLVISILVAIALVGTFVGITMMVVDQGGQQPNNNDPRMVTAGLMFLGGIGSALVGLILGILGSMQPNTSPICAILGIVFNSLILLGVGGMVCMGVAIGGG
ncbi:MAG: hypothetical protein EXS16_07810 [Gemmataceae bacterium]|nr:hypothetical protein [Gemmataceae bacterium]